MKFGFIGFGEVSYTLSKILLEYGFEVLSSDEGRSQRTRELLGSLDITVLDSLKDVALKSDVLISANSPQSALAVAVEYGSLTEGVFLDFNNISPKTAKQIENYISPDHFIDSAIMGRVSNNELNIFFSGKKAQDFVDKIYDLANESKLDNANESRVDNANESRVDNANESRVDNANTGVKINLKVVSDEIGDVSSLKTLRSSYTKGVSALLVETFETAQKLALEDELWDVLSLTENRDFETASKSRIKSSYDASNRRYEELKEILEFLDDVDDDEDSKIMALAIRDKFKYLKDK